MRPDRILSMLSIAAKAGRIVSGGFQTEKAIQSQEACLVIIAEDASDNTKKKYTDSCAFYEIPCIVYGQSENLGHCIGKEFRKTLAVTDPGIAGSIVKKTEVIG